MLANNTIIDQLLQHPLLDGRKLSPGNSGSTLIVLGVGLIATLLVVLAYGLSLLYTRLLPFDIGQATLFALSAIIAVTALVWRCAHLPRRSG